MIGSYFPSGDLGVVHIYFDGQDWGLTLEDTSIKESNDYTEIKKAQKGTKPVDKYRTGTIWIVKAKFTDFNKALLSNNPSIVFGGGSSPISAKLGASLYQSLIANAKTCKIVRVESDLSDTTDPAFILNFYKAVPVFPEMDWTFSPDKQRSIEVQIECYFDENRGAYGYFGNASSVGLSAI